MTQSGSEVSRIKVIAEDDFFVVWNFKTSDTTENCTKVIAEGNFLVISLLK